jgi:hypothetical protein
MLLNKTKLEMKWRKDEESYYGAEGVNSVNTRLEQTTPSTHVFSTTKVWMGKYLKKSCA